MIRGIGIDIVDVGRFRKALDRWGERLYRKVFTWSEIEYCRRQRFPERHLAARFAAKVSLTKAMGRPVRFKDVEVTRGSGGPGLKVRGLGKEINLSVTMTHDRNLSVAETIVERCE